VDEPKPPGQIVAGWAFSKIPVVGDLAKDLYHNVNEWRRYRAERTGEQIAEIVGPEELYERARENDELAALLAQVLEIAERTGFEAKRRLLVLAVANAFRNDEAIDPAVLVTNALSQLDTVHVRTLARLAALSDSFGPTPEEVDSDADREHVEKMMRAGEQVPLPVLVALVNTGVVRQSTMVFGGGTHLHDVSPFGRQLLRDLQNADPEDESIRWVPPN
jgi:hypothetical protein